MPFLKLQDIYNWVMCDTGIKYIATGAKNSDSIWRRYNMTTIRDNICCPIKEWNKFEVLWYLKKHDIPIPNSSNAQATGIDLTTKSLLWLFDNYPNDFDLLCSCFPYARAVVKRRNFYGI